MRRSDFGGKRLPRKLIKFFPGLDFVCETKRKHDKHRRLRVRSLSRFRLWAADFLIFRQSKLLANAVTGAGNSFESTWRWPNIACGLGNSFFGLFCLRVFVCNAERENVIVESGRGT